MSAGPRATRPGPLPSTPGHPPPLERSGAKGAGTRAPGRMDAAVHATRAAPPRPPGSLPRLSGRATPPPARHPRLCSPPRCAEASLSPAGLGVERAMLARHAGPCSPPARPLDRRLHGGTASTAPVLPSRPPAAPSWRPSVGASPSLRSYTPYRPFRGGGVKGDLPSPTAAPPPAATTRLPLRAVP